MRELICADLHRTFYVWHRYLTCGVRYPMHYIWVMLRHIQINVSHCIQGRGSLSQLKSAGRSTLLPVSFHTTILLFFSTPSSQKGHTTMSNTTNFEHLQGIFGQSPGHQCVHPTRKCSRKKCSRAQLDVSCSASHKANEVPTGQQHKLLAEVHAAEKHADGFVLVDKIVRYARLMACRHHQKEEFEHEMESRAFLLAMTLKGRSLVGRAGLERWGKDVSKIDNEDGNVDVAYASTPVTEMESGGSSPFRDSPSSVPSLKNHGTGSYHASPSQQQGVVRETAAGISPPWTPPYVVNNEPYAIPIPAGQRYRTPFENQPSTDGIRHPLHLDFNTASNHSRTHHENSHSLADFQGQADSVLYGQEYYMFANRQHRRLCVHLEQLSSNAFRGYDRHAD